MPVRPLTIPCAILALLFVCSTATAQRTAIAERGPVEDLPSQFASRADAIRNGGDFVRVEGPTVDARVMAVREEFQRQMHVLVYTLAPDSSFGATHHLVVPTGTWDPTLSFLNVTGTDWLVFDHMQSGGTGILRFALLVVAWDGQRFRPVASESLDYTCARPTSVANYQLKVRHAFASNGGGVSLRFDYELLKDEKRLGGVERHAPVECGAFRVRIS